MKLVTERLVLLPCSLEMLKSLVDDRINLGQIAGVQVPESWPMEDLQDAAPFFIDILVKYPEMEGRLNWLIVEKSQNMLIGSIGFKGKPSENGETEIGFGLDSSYWRKGYATEAAKELIGWAFLQDDIQKITAECDFDNTASKRVLEKVGMCNIAERDNMLYWELCR